MKIAVVLLNFGEPENATVEEVVPFLERIFSLNASLMGPATPEEVRARSRSLAEARAPGLIEEYERIGGSPLHRQAREQAGGVEAALRRRGLDASVFLGMQFTSPSIEEGIARARRSGAERLVGLPVYPLCGPTTTVAALQETRSAVGRSGWEVPFLGISGWHRHPAYVRLRADAIRALLERDGLSLADPGTRLLFSAHGTPVRYLREGSRYEQYVREFCDLLAAEVGAPAYALGYQNHTNRPGVEWTRPDVDRVVAEIDAERIVVDPISFMHEQSETLAELDHELRGVAVGRGLGFHRVPVPHAEPAFFELLSDLVEGVLREAGERRAGEAGLLGRCRCEPGSYCLNNR